MLTHILKYVVAKRRISEREPQHNRSLNLGANMYNDNFEIASVRLGFPKEFSVVSNL